MYWHLEDWGFVYLEVGHNVRLKCQNDGKWMTAHYATASCFDTGLTLGPCKYSSSAGRRHLCVSHSDIFFLGCSWLNPTVSDGRSFSHTLTPRCTNDSFPRLELLRTEIQPPLLGALSRTGSHFFCNDPPQARVNKVFCVKMFWNCV